MTPENGRFWPRVRTIARHHFMMEVRKRSFIILLFSLPLLIGVSVGIGILSESLTHEPTVLGYVDPSGFLTDTALDEEDTTLIQFESEEAAQQALDAEEINGYYLLSADFAADRDAELVYYQPPDWQAQVAFSDMVRRNHLAGIPPNVAQRIVEGSDVVVQPLSSNRTFGNNPEVTDFLPVITALIFGFVTVTTSGYMMEALVTEKENRTMEILVSSISAGKLMTGKIIGGLGIAGVQLLVYIVCLFIGVIIGRLAGVSWLLELHPRWVDVIQVVLVAIPVYLFLTALFTMIGAMLTESNDAQQVGPFSFLLLLLPIYVMPALINDLNGSLALTLSFFPPTAMMTFALRLLVIEIPWWQVIASMVISLASGGGLIWLAAKAFRLGMLRYGQRLHIRDLIGRPATR